MSRGVLFNLQRFSTHDGPGLRTTVFLKGCPLRCLWCHNPEGLRPRPELLEDVDRCIACRSCAEAGCEAEAAEACPTGAKRMAGWELTVSELMAELRRDRIYFEESGGGVTFSGGEPLAQPDFLLEALDSCGREGIPAVLDTCGAAPRDTLLRAAARCEVVLFDLKGMDEARHRAATGASLGPLLENLEALCAVHPRVWLRLPLVPDQTDAPEDLDAAAELAARLRPEKVCLLPYHRLGTDKRRQLGQVVHDFAPPSQEACVLARDRFIARGVPAQIGG